MEEKKFIYVYYDEDDLLWKINALKEEGYKEENMYVIVKDKEEILMTKGQMDINVESAGLQSWRDRFAAFLLGEKPVRDALLRIGLSTGMCEEEAEKHYTDVITGGMLLYVDTNPQNNSEQFQPASQHTGQNLEDYSI
ncbi:general stress protein [Domibacillus sp. PGB-M46]|uniref:general stress protein n=1 Tax=Domibacillus sp. PGB-M46 TaxID=2910255 RepID=UPI001F59B0E8|nr:general stress protein [Domibacillus sp. PGB-M46]MCI2256106.1 general stress protein [Domibacillus sp. PGB-M46]